MCIQDTGVRTTPSVPPISSEEGFGRGEGSGIGAGGEVVGEVEEGLSRSV